jgi:hypothetical protein
MPPGVCQENVTEKNGSWVLRYKKEFVEEEARGME